MLNEGAEIGIGSGGFVATTGRVATIRKWQGHPCIVTCGHVFLDGDHDQVIVDGVVIAELVENLLTHGLQRDVAFARLTDEGLEMVGAPAPRTTGPPGSEVQLIRVDNSSPMTKVVGPPVHYAYLPSGGPFIRTNSVGEQEGDSGAPLVTRSGAPQRLCGLLTGYGLSGSVWYAYYTPLYTLF